MRKKKKHSNGRDTDIVPAEVDSLVELDPAALGTMALDVAADVANFMHRHQELAAALEHERLQLDASCRKLESEVAIVRENKDVVLSDLATFQQVIEVMLRKIEQSGAEPPEPLLEQLARLMELRAQVTLRFLGGGA